MSGRSFLERLWYPDRPERPGEALLRSPLWAPALAWRGIVAARNALYDRGLLEARRVEGARVVSVGNITVGGAGKTPVVIHLANRALGQGRKVAVLSRGHGRRSDGVVSLVGAHEGSIPPDAWMHAGDEPLLIARRCPGVHVIVGADRVATAHRAVAEYGCDLILLDDGMQHRRLVRDADVVVLDEAIGLGNGAPLPRGPLRESSAALGRASLVWRRVADRPVPLPEIDAPTVRARHAPTAVLTPEGERPVEALCGMNVFALCALARPSSFVRTLERLGAEVVGTRFGPDHHGWTEAELAAALASAARLGAQVVTTEKDRVKLPADAPVWTVRLDVEVLEGSAHLDALLAGPARTG